MTTCVRILSSSSVDSSPSILLVASDGTKILVNCGEGCQRCFLEYGQRLSTVTTVLLCDTHPPAVGGLPGMILTTADATAAAEASALLIKSERDGLVDSKTNVDAAASPPLNGLQIIGPTGTKQYIHSLRHFMRRDKFLVTVHEGNTDAPMPVYLSRGRAAKKPKPNAKPVDEVGFTVQSLAVAMNDMAPNAPLTDTRKHARDEDGDDGAPRREALSFIVQTPPIQGKFLAQTALELGVPKGPLYAKLKTGQSVSFIDATTQTERTVHSHQVVTPASPAVVVLILYYPTVAVAKRLFESSQLVAVVDSTVTVVELVIHVAPPELRDDYGLPFWTHRTSTEHVWLSTTCTVDVDGTLFRSASQGAKARSILCPELYACPRPPAASHVTLQSTEYRVGRATMEYTLIPRTKRGFNETAWPLAITERMDQEALQLVTTTGAKAQAQTILDATVPSNDPNQPTGELFFTGTGSAMPCKHRNVTGMLLKQADGRSILLDVGEGTIGQLLRVESAQSSHDLLANIKAVWISHPHADHHLGLLRLLTDRVSNDALLVLAPTPIFRFLDEYALIDPSIRGTYDAIDSSLLVETDQHASVQEKIQTALGIASCRSVPVAHCAHAYAVILDGTSFGRVVYSGDCRPSFQLAQAALGADLLIHEATFEDGMEAEAALKKHSTVGEALAVSLAMQCRCTILTHFSQRYPKIPPTPADESSKIPIIFAFDYLRLSSNNLLLAANMTPALRLLFPETNDEPPSSVASKVLSVPGVFAVSKLL